MSTSSPAAKPANTMTSSAAADVMMRPVRSSPMAMARSLSPVVVPRLLDAGEQEHLVVHRQPEGEQEHDERHGGVERADGVEAEQARQVAVLEHPHEHAERGARATARSSPPP